MKAKSRNHLLNTAAVPSRASVLGCLDLKIIEVPPQSLKPHPRNARTHSKKQIRQIRDSIRTFGFVTPVLIDNDGLIVAGHARTQAAIAEALPSIPCVQVGHLSPEEIRAYMLADNKHAINAGWDLELLAEELNDLHLTMQDLDFETIGFTIAETDSLIEGLTHVENGNPADDILPPIANQPHRCQPGDIWTSWLFIRR